MSEKVYKTPVALLSNDLDESPACGWFKLRKMRLLGEGQGVEEISRVKIDALNVDFLNATTGRRIAKLHGVSLLQEEDLRYMLSN